MTDSKVELLDFWAVWCGPCKIMEPILNEIETEYEGKVTLKKCNVDDEDNSELLDKYQIMSMPTYIILVNGEVHASFVGVTSKETFTRELDAAINKT